MSEPTEQEIQSLLVNLISDGFNRSLAALEQAGAIDTKKLRTEYRGIGSKYYDLVTAQIELSATYGVPAFKTLMK